MNLLNSFRSLLHRDDYHAKYGGYKSKIVDIHKQI